MNHSQKCLTTHHTQATHTYTSHRPADNTPASFTPSLQNCKIAPRILTCTRQSTSAPPPLKRVPCKPDTRSYFFGPSTGTTSSINDGMCSCPVLSCPVTKASRPTPPPLRVMPGMASQTTGMPGLHMDVPIVKNNNDGKRPPKSRSLFYSLHVNKPRSSGSTSPPLAPVMSPISRPRPPTPLLFPMAMPSRPHHPEPTVPPPTEPSPTEPSPTEPSPSPLPRLPVAP